jgi:release factor glutamine methyltransferase
MKRLLKTLTPVLRPLILRYLKKRREYKYEHLSLIVNPGVFHPGIFFSTKFLLTFLKTQDLKQKQVLELGAGSGLIAIYCSTKKGSIVTASDISLSAIENLGENAQRNHANLTIVHSNLFQSLDAKIFDVIIINPPYYAKNPMSESDHAWFCGADFQYFKSLFSQLKECKEEALILMILSEDCEIEKITSLARQAAFGMLLVKEKRIWGEENYIFKIQKAS